MTTEIELAETLDRCIKRIVGGETIEACLVDYPDARSEIEPLLYTASSIATTPRPVAPEAFRIMSEARLLARIRRETAQSREARSRQDTSTSNTPGYQWLRQAFTGMKRTAVPVAMTVLLVIGAAIGGLRILGSSPALASQCTLSILSGSVEIQALEETSWQQCVDGITLTEGDRVRTTANSSALLTFFEGSTIKLESDTDIQIQQVERAQDESIRITLKQWLGRTWSRVVKMAGPGSHYEIETPSATAVVRGTLFSTIVDETGSTEVETTSGLVSVVAQGKEVYLPPNQKTKVQAGSAPSQPETVPAINNELVIRVDMPAVASLCDPTGSSTGTLLTGQSFNQIAGSLSSVPAEDTQYITVPDPIEGEYVLALRYIAQGTTNFNIEAQSDGEPVFEYSGSLEADEGSGWLIRFNLKTEGGLISSGEIVGIETLGDKAPEKIVEHGKAAGIQQQSDTQSQPQDNGPNESKGQGQGRDNIQEQPNSKSGVHAEGKSQDQSQDQDSKLTKGKKDETDVDEGIHGFLDTFFKRVDEHVSDTNNDLNQPDKQEQDQHENQGQPDTKEQDKNEPQD